MIFNKSKETWDWCGRMFQNADIKLVPGSVAIVHMELRMAQKADSTADVVFFDDDDQPDKVLEQAWHMDYDK